MNTYALIHIPIRNVHTHTHTRVRNDRSLHVNKALPIAGNAIVAFTLLPYFGASSNANTTRRKL